MALAHRDGVPHGAVQYDRTTNWLREQRDMASNRKRKQPPTNNDDSLDDGEDDRTEDGLGGEEQGRNDKDASTGRRVGGYDGYTPSNPNSSFVLRHRDPRTYARRTDADIPRHRDRATMRRNLTTSRQRR